MAIAHVNAKDVIIFQINVKDHRFAKYVENHIPFQDLRAFVFQRKDDMETFMTEVSEQQPMVVSWDKSFDPRQSSEMISLLSHSSLSFSQVRDKMNLKVNSISAPEKSCSKAEASRNIEHLR